MSDTTLTQLSPLRNTTTQTNPASLAQEQALHFGIDVNSEYGQALTKLSEHLYSANMATHDLWRITLDGLASLERKDRIAWFNAKRFLSFQLAKILDTMQNPMRATYQSIGNDHPGATPKGAYPLFDNVAAIFSATPVITRTATYIFACTEWVEDAFHGREPLHDIYSRLLNPTSISLANHIVDLECGKEANKYMAWNFNSGMAAVDGVLSHVLGRDDIVIVARNVYGGTFQLLNDWYAREANLGINLEWVDGFDAASYKAALDAATTKYADQLAAGRKIYMYLESPCNPHGYVLDVPGICRAAHEQGCRIITDTTVGTPFLHPVLKHEDPMARPDFVIHSYTKELAGSGTTTAGVVIARNEDMFIPKGGSVEATWPDGSPRTVEWEESMFWNVFYIKGAFLDSDKAFEVLNGIKTYEMRVIQKAINTTVLARVLDSHPAINVSCPALETNSNHPMLQEHMHLGLPAGLFTIDFEGAEATGLTREAFKRFLDILEPAVGMQVSLGQTSTVGLCPALTTHSEMGSEEQVEAGIHMTTIRVAVGLEDPRILIAHIQRSAELALDPVVPGFSSKLPSSNEIDAVLREVTKDVHERNMASLPSYDELLG